MEFPPTQTFPTLIDPDDTFEDLVEQARVRLSNDPMLSGLDDLAAHFAPEPISELRMVPVRLVQGHGRYEDCSIDTDAVLKRFTEWGFAPLSLHAFLAFLGQHRDACRNFSGTTVPTDREVNGYQCVFRFYDRDGFQRDLNLMPVREVKQSRYRTWPTWSEIYAVEPVREGAQARIFNNSL